MASATKSETPPGAARRPPTLRPIMGYMPTTFLERGVAVPFTTPQLAGARARPADRRQLELLVPNPSGGLGIYVLAWDDLSALCRPTVFDTRLVAAVATLRGVTPAAIRETATAIAAEGLAGRAALVAAGAAREASRQSSLVTNFDLLLELVRQVEPADANPVAPEDEQPARLELRARAAVARIAPALGHTAQAVANQLEQLARLYSGLGVGQHVGRARVPMLIAAMIRLRDDAAAWAEQHADSSAQEAALVAMVADLTIACTRTALAEAQGLTKDIVALLRRWNNAPDRLADLLARPDWLLDGWERVVALWQSAEAHLGPAATLVEMARMVPVIPKEAASWVSTSLELQAPVLRHRRKVLLLEDWNTGGTVLDVVARNEALLTPTLLADPLPDAAGRPAVRPPR